ncbi:MAG: four helix bundle protein [Prevotellaceae bacterium]|nr:four helix bundle protein [Candidatus Minthosoma caballi]
MTTSFTDIKAWQFSHEFVLMVYKITKTFPEDEKYGLTSQFRRAAVSIPANIAEGYKKLSKADKLRFFNIAQGSLEECRYYIILSEGLKYINKEEENGLLEQINKASWYLNAYCNGVSNNNGIVR